MQAKPFNSYSISASVLMQYLGHAYRFESRFCNKELPPQTLYVNKSFVNTIDLSGGPPEYPDSFPAAAIVAVSFDGG